MQNADISLLPLGTSSFKGLRGLHQIYVDKTDLIFQLARTRNKFFLARPRRFGKTLLTLTFKTLFQNGLSDFKGLAIEKLWKDKTYNVVHLDFSEVNEFTDLSDFKNKFCSRIAKKFKNSGFILDPNDDDVISQLSDWLEQLPVNSLVYLIDEYDAPLTACIHDKKLFEGVRSVLSEFFKMLESKDDCMRFFFMTGITKYSSTGIFSGFNVFTDISLDAEYNTILGWTEEEIGTYFNDYLENAAKILNLAPEELIENLRTHYDGFCFDSKASTHVYCPWSVLKFLTAPHNGFESYWYKSGGCPEVLTNFLKNHELENPVTYAQDKIISLDRLSDSRDYYSIDLTAILAQAGYLTIKSVSKSKVVRLGYPNLDVSFSMARLYSDTLLANQPLPLPDDPWLPDLLAGGKIEKVIEQFNLVANAIDYKKYPIADEATCRAYIQVLLIGAALVPHVELHSALGRSDLEVDAGDFHWVFEFKFAKTAQDVPSCLSDAKDQIQSRRYGETLHGKKLIRVALVFCAEARQFTAFEEI